MNPAMQKFQHEIEVEQLWIATENCGYVFFVMTPIILLMVYGLWDNASHALLIVWSGLIIAVHVFRLVIFSHYHRDKAKLIRNKQKFKRIIMLVASLTSVCWILCVLWFIDIHQPTTAMLISMTLLFDAAGGVMTWICYLPAVVVISFPATLIGLVIVFLMGGRVLNTAALLLLPYPISGTYFCYKIREMLNHALFLNFENAALRQESEEKSMLLETALENMSQGISMSDSQDRLRMWNRKFIDLLGTAGNQVAANVKLDSLLDAADCPIHLSAEPATEYRLPNGDVYAIRQSQLSLGGRVLTYTDISDLIKREQALEQARKLAEQANAAKTRFLAAASHDLRQPIHALGLFFEELSDRVSAPETVGLIGQVEDSIATINSMLNALLDVSKLDAGVVKPCFAPCALSELLQRLQTEFQGMAQENQNELRMRLVPAIVNTDAVMLERMLRNLIANAIRYTHHGRILILTRRRGHSVEIQILDTGIGIPADQLDEIFIEFHQLQNPARDRHQGLGLGLAIVQRLAKLLQHEVKVVSRLQHGSCFSIRVPLADAGQIQLAAQQNKAKMALKNEVLVGCPVLVVDDDTAVLDGMRGLLSRWGCKVLSARSAEQALELLAQSTLRLALLIIDYRLPDNISGIDLAQQIQKDLAYPLAVLIITGDTGPERLREADASGYPLLHKPVQPAKLRSTLQYLLAKQSSDLG